MKKKFKKVTFIDGSTRLEPVRDKRSEYVYERSAPVRKLVRNRSKDRSETVRTAERTRHARRKPKNHTPFTYFSTAIAFGMLAFGLASTYFGFDWKVQLSLYVITAVIVLSCDVLGLFGRFLATNTRLLISLSLLLLTINIFAQNERLGTVSSIVFCLLLVCSYYLNSKWLDIENYDLSPEVQKVLINSNENKAALVWEDDGYKKARTLLWNLGNTFTDEELHGVYRPLFLLGYNMGWSKTEKGNVKLQKAEERAEKNQRKAERLEKELKEAKKETHELAEMLRKEQENSSLYMSQRDRMEKRLSQVKAQHDSLLSANSDLMEIVEAQEATQEAPQDVIRLVSDNVDETIKSYLESGLSVSKTAKLLEPLGVKRWKVAEISKTLNRTDTKIIDMQQATA